MVCLDLGKKSLTLQTCIQILVPFWFNTRPESCDEEILDKLKNVGLDECL